MKYILTFILVLLFSGCSAKYKTLKEYHKANASITQLNQCQTQLKSCQKRCEAKFNRCKVKADKIAQNKYEKALKDYYKELEAYANALNEYNLERDMEFVFYDDPFCYGRSPFYHRRVFYDPFWYSYRPFPLRKPQKPSFEQMKLKEESLICDLDCGCGKSYDSCFINSGGEIKYGHL